jgi:hypothetical protein
MDPLGGRDRRDGEGGINKHNDGGGEGRGASHTAGSCPKS